MFLNAHQIEPLIQGTPGKKAQVGIDLTVCNIRQIGGGFLYKDKTVVHPYYDKRTEMQGDNEGWYLIAGHAYSVTFEQGIKLGSIHTAFIRHRSSLLRMGWTCTSGVYDPGFEVDQMGAVIMGTSKIFIEKGARIAQIIVAENYNADLYNGQWQGEKDVK